MLCKLNTLILYKIGYPVCVARDVSQRLMIKGVPGCDLKVWLKRYLSRFCFEKFHRKNNLIENFKSKKHVLHRNIILEPVLMKMKVLIFNCLMLYMDLSYRIIEMCKLLTRN